ncbi:hypothetical protein HOP52_02970 [Halomonas campisalis]|uniref:Uncharacterized protein n=1 Tax=Billgrantia campisalis TaxID=74661 RepID=A0ABS9P660_9GAMM|nr:hypothetical protein [Halomonas campisalis]MCG6656737.1 hypothetical protein [Halomonas campisalis]MDR5861926.1 hypothetical protein [Halomonas campisalis]
MTTSQNTRTSTWLERFFEASASQVAREIRSEAPCVYEQLVGDLQTPLTRPFEAAMAKRLANGDMAGLIPARTLMPEMMARFGVTPTRFEEGRELAALERTCNRCPVVGHCWQAMRAGAEVEECRGFCPNAEAFERRAGG